MSMIIEPSRANARLVALSRLVSALRGLSDAACAVVDDVALYGVYAREFAAERRAFDAAAVVLAASQPTPAVVARLAGLRSEVADYAAAMGDSEVEERVDLVSQAERDDGAAIVRMREGDIQTAFGAVPPGVETNACIAIACIYTGLCAKTASVWG